MPGRWTSRRPARNYAVATAQKPKDDARVAERREDRATEKPLGGQRIGADVVGNRHQVAAPIGECHWVAEHQRSREEKVESEKDSRCHAHEGRPRIAWSPPADALEPGVPHGGVTRDDERDQQIRHGARRREPGSQRGDNQCACSAEGGQVPVSLPLESQHPARSEEARMDRSAGKGMAQTTFDSRQRVGRQTQRDAQPCEGGDHGQPPRDRGGTHDAISLEPLGQEAHPSPAQRRSS